MISKECPSCKTIKASECFYKKNSVPSGLANSCKECESKAKKKASRTKDGVASLIYDNQKKNSVRRGHPMPSYTRSELKDWLFNQELFCDVFRAWEKSDFMHELKPSVDRIDDYVGYTLENIQVSTWGDNRSRVYRDKMNGINNKQNRAIVQLDKGGNVINEFYSIHEAHRRTGVARENISKCCNNNAKTAGGYIWKLKKQ